MNKLTYLLFIAFVMAACGKRPAKADTSIQTVAIIQEFKTGERYLYKLEQLNGSNKVDQSTDIEMWVEKDTAGLQICSWKYGPTVLSDKGLVLDDIGRKELNLFEGITLRFTIDSVGMFREFLNKEACEKELARRMVELEKMRLPINNLDAIIQSIENMFEDTDYILKGTFPEVNNLFKLAGRILQPDSTYQTSVNEIRIAGNPPISFKSTTMLRNIGSNKESFNIKVHTETTADGATYKTDEEYTYLKDRKLITELTILTYIPTLMGQYTTDIFRLRLIQH